MCPIVSAIQIRHVEWVTTKFEHCFCDHISAITFIRDIEICILKFDNIKFFSRKNNKQCATRWKMCNYYHHARENISLLIMNKKGKQFATNKLLAARSRLLLNKVEENLSRYWHRQQVGQNMILWCSGICGLSFLKN